MKKLNKYKYIVNTGGSYGKMLESVLTPYFHIPDSFSDKLKSQYKECHLEGDIENIIGINVQCNSLGSGWQSDSVIYTVSKLLENGINPKNIYVFIEWSQYNRVSYPMIKYMQIKENNLAPTSYPSPGDMPLILSNDKNEFKQIHDTADNLSDSVPTEIQELIKNINIGNTFKIGNVGHIDKNFYVNPVICSKKYFSEQSLEFELYHDTILDLDNKLSPDIKVKMHIDNILKTQYFLDSKKIEWNSVDMHSFHSNWMWSEFQELHNQFCISDDKTKLIDTGHFGEEEPNNLNKKNIEDIFDNYDFLLQQIRHDKHYFYQSKNYNRGGIDEYIIDNFKKCGFVNLKKEHHLNLHMKLEELIPGYEQHPNQILYLLMWNEIAKDCKFLKVKKTFEDFVLKKYWEDYNHPKAFSKNGITISRQTWAQLTKIDNNE